MQFHQKKKLGSWGETLIQGILGNHRLPVLTLRQAGFEPTYTDFVIDEASVKP